MAHFYSALTCLTTSSWQSVCALLCTGICQRLLILTLGQIDRAFGSPSFPSPSLLLSICFSIALCVCFCLCLCLQRMIYWRSPGLAFDAFVQHAFWHLALICVKLGKLQQLAKRFNACARLIRYRFSYSYVFDLLITLIKRLSLTATDWLWRLRLICVSLSLDWLNCSIARGTQCAKATKTSLLRLAVDSVSLRHVASAAAAAEVKRRLGSAHTQATEAAHRQSYCHTLKCNP